MGDNAEQDLPTDNAMFFIGENEARREMPQYLRDRLTQNQMSKPTYALRERERNLRVTEMKEEKQKRLREHHEKVIRLAAEKHKRRQETSGNAGMSEQPVVTELPDELERTMPASMQNGRASA